MKVTIDRFEGDYAVVETQEKNIFNIPKALLPHAKEGDVINIEIDEEETKKRTLHIKQMMDDLWEGF